MPSKKKEEGLGSQRSPEKLLLLTALLIRILVQVTSLSLQLVGTYIFIRTWDICVFTSSCKCSCYAFHDVAFGHYTWLWKKGLSPGSPDFITQFVYCLPWKSYKDKTLPSDCRGTASIWALLMSNGTASLLERARVMESSFSYLNYCLMMLVCIEEAEKNLHNVIDELEPAIQNTLAYLVNCPRQIVRRFHRRNNCKCLQQLYYHLKETRKREAACITCDKLFKLKSLYKCARCNVSEQTVP
jgi:hypothetical protein